jgi:hypothetical protein
MERERERREGRIKITVPTYGKVQTFHYLEFKQTNQFLF